MGHSLGLVAEKGHVYVAKDQIQVEPGRKDCEAATSLRALAAAPTKNSHT